MKRKMIPAGRSVHLALAVLFTFVLVGCAETDSGTDPSDESNAATEIREVMQQQADAWNGGDIRGYMAGYARTDTLRFASGGNVWRGWEPTLQRYLESYPDEGMMGRLSFSDLEVWPITEEHAVAFGRWELTRSEMYENIGGLFTLVFEKRPDGWRIVHDHTSSRQTIESERADTADAQ